MPRIFVPGPSVGNPSIGSPAEFIKQIANTTNRFRTNAQRDTLLENNRLFRQEEQQLNERKQDFTEGADGRARAEAEFKRGLANQRAQEQSAAVAGAGGSLRDQFLARPETQASFLQDNITDPEEQRKIVDQMFAEDKALFSNSKVAGQTAFDSIVAGGGGIAEAEAARAAAQRQIFKTPLSGDLAGKLLIKPDGGSSAASLFGKAGKGTTATAPLQGIPNQISSEELQKLLNDKLGVEGNRFSLFGWRPTDNEFLGGAHDLEQSDVTSLQGQFSQDLRPETIQRVLMAVGDPQDGTVKFSPKNMSQTEKDDFLALGKELEAKANEGRASTGPLAGLSFQDVQKLEQDRFRQIADFNTGIINQTSIQNSDFDDRIGALRKRLGQPNGADAAIINTRQGGNQGGTAQGAPTVAPDVVPDGEASDSTELDKLLTPPASAPAPAPTGGPSLIGGDPTDRLFGGLQENIEAITSRMPAAVAADAIGKLFKSAQDFLPQGQDLSASQRTPQAVAQAKADDIEAIEKRIQNLPQHDDRTLAQKKLHRELTQELKDLRDLQ